MEKEKVDFNDLPKKIQKKIMRELFLKDVRPVTERPIENGTVQILNYIKNHPYTERKDIVESLGFQKKKVKRILGQMTGKMVKEIFLNKELRYVYIGEKFLEK